MPWPGAFRTGSRFNQSPITYLGPDGRQYVAIIASSAANNGAVAFDAAPDNANRYRRSGSTLYVWALPETEGGYLLTLPPLGNVLFFAYFAILWYVPQAMQLFHRGVEAT